MSSSSSTDRKINSSISPSTPPTSIDIVAGQEPQPNESPLKTDAQPQKIPSPSGSHTKQNLPARLQNNNDSNNGSIDHKPEPSNDSTADAQPLAPPPRPFPNNTSDLSDRAARNKNHFNLEPNPFEQSFGNQSGSSAAAAATAGDTQNKELLPSVASLTSPSSLLPGGTPGWSNSLRSGPLSPAMLAGPAGGDYFSDSHFRTGFPTPNESSLRTGLTPGGGGSMFPAPSPNTQAFINSLQGNGNNNAAGNGAAATGGATPNTIDFHRTALSAAAAAAASAAAASAKPPAFNLRRNAPMGSRAAESSGQVVNSDQKPFQASGASQSGNTASSQDPFAQHDTDAANGLYMLANANGSRNNSHFSVANQSTTTHTANANATGTSGEDGTAMGSAENIANGQSPARSRRNTKNSVVSISGSVNGTSEPGDFSGSDRSEQEKPALARPKSKKASHSKTTSIATTSSNATGNINSNFSATRRKGEDIDSKAPPIKRSRKSSSNNINNRFTSTAAAAAGGDMAGDMDESEEEDDSMMDTRQELGGRKMTDEEKRKNFLERNRVAALKCRQRKKQWLANLQAKVELFSTENDALTAQVTQMREEIVNLKTLLIAHKDCTVSQAQGLSGLAMQSFLGDVAHHANPFGSLGIHHQNGGHNMGSSNGGGNNGDDLEAGTGGARRR